MSLATRQINKITELVNLLPPEKKDELIEVIVEGTPRHVKILLSDGSIYFFRPGTAETWTGRTGAKNFGVDLLMREVSRRLGEVAREKGKQVPQQLPNEVLYALHALKEAKAEVDRCAQRLNEALLKTGAQIETSKI
jgi:hypothetical protein